MVACYSVTFTYNERRGRIITPNQVVGGAPAAVRRARESTLGVKGARLFNLLHASIRNINSDNTDTFIRALDSFLSQVPVQPTVLGCPRAAETNSYHQIPMYVKCCKLVYYLINLC